MAKAKKSTIDQAREDIEFLPFDIVKAFVEKALGHGLAATDGDKAVIEAALEELRPA